MPISGVLLTCNRHQVHQVADAIEQRPFSEVRSAQGDVLVVVTDTPMVDADREEINALGELPGVLLTHVVFTNLEDIAAAEAQLSDLLKEKSR